MSIDIVQTNLAFIPECKYDWEIIKKLWEQLEFDPGFFIFFEGTYTQLRCNFKYTQKVLDWSKKNNVRTSGFTPWVEPWEHTKKHQDWYQKLFHLYTEAMFMFDSPEDLKQAVDRVCHCFLNMQRKILLEKAVDMNNMDTILQEANMIATAAVERALTVGWIGRGVVDKKEKDKND